MGYPTIWRMKTKNLNPQFKLTPHETLPLPIRLVPPQPGDGGWGEGQAEGPFFPRASVPRAPSIFGEISPKHRARRSLGRRGARPVTPLPLSDSVALSSTQ